MSIEAVIKKAKIDGKLFPALPLVQWAPCHRAFLMCAQVYAELQKGRTNVDQIERQTWANIEAAMGFFIEGGYVTDDFIKQLSPSKYEHWELKIRRPKPSLRMFGRFAMPDVFIGTHVVARSTLNGMWSPEFEHEKLVCEDHWKNAGLGKPFSHPTFEYEQYITSNASKKVRVKK